MVVECAADDRITADLATAEAIALPLTAFLLIWVFGSAIVALLRLTILRDADGLRGVPAFTHS